MVYYCSIPIPIPPCQQSYPGFNLLAADLVRRRMAYLCSKEAEVGPQAVAPGLHGMTNGRIDSHELHWPKVG